MMIIICILNTDSLYPQQWATKTLKRLIGILEKLNMLLKFSTL